MARERELQLRLQEYKAETARLSAETAESALLRATAAELREATKKVLYSFPGIGLVHKKILKKSTARQLGCSHRTLGGRAARVRGRADRTLRLSGRPPRETVSTRSGPRSKKNFLHFCRNLTYFFLEPWRRDRQNGPGIAARSARSRKGLLSRR